MARARLASRAIPIGPSASRRRLRTPRSAVFALAAVNRRPRTVTWTGVAAARAAASMGSSSGCVVGSSATISTAAAWATAASTCWVRGAGHSLPAGGSSMVRAGRSPVAAEAAPARAHGLAAARSACSQRKQPAQWPVGSWPPARLARSAAKRGPRQAAIGSSSVVRAVAANAQPRSEPSAAIAIPRVGSGHAVQALSVARSPPALRRAMSRAIRSTGRSSPRSTAGLEGACCLSMRVGGEAVGPRLSAWRGRPGDPIVLGGSG